MSSMSISVIGLMVVIFGAIVVLGGGFAFVYWLLGVMNKKDE